MDDNENLLKTYQKKYDDMGRKYDDALLKIDQMRNFSGRALDKLRNEIIDRDDVVNRLLTEIDAQREEINRTSGEAGRAIRMMNDRRLLIKGAADFSIPKITSRICTHW